MSASRRGARLLTPGRPQVRELQKRSGEMPDEHLLVLVGDMVTEEALPTYMTMLNTLDGVRDETGASETAWAQWTRKWTAEENRHGDAMNKYLWLTGKVNMKAVEVTIQNLIGSGMDPKTENNPYLGFIYTSFQERATKVCHGNTARFAKEHGDDVLSKMCGLIAADEGRHEVAYQRIVDELFKRDPEGTMLAFADMMNKQIVMPAHMMNDGEHHASTGKDLFADYSAVAERTGVYTPSDYVDIMQHLIDRWNVGGQKVSGEAAKAQEFLMKQPARIRKLADFAAKKKAAKAHTENRHENFSWCVFFSFARCVLRCCGCVCGSLSRALSGSSGAPLRCKLLSRSHTAAADRYTLTRWQNVQFVLNRNLAETNESPSLCVCMSRPYDSLRQPRATPPPRAPPPPPPPRHPSSPPPPPPHHPCSPQGSTQT